MKESRGKIITPIIKIAFPAGDNRRNISDEKPQIPDIRGVKPERLTGIKSWRAVEIVEDIVEILNWTNVKICAISSRFWD
jgi:hypothetical protein